MKPTYFIDATQVLPTTKRAYGGIGAIGQPREVDILLNYGCPQSACISIGLSLCACRLSSYFCFTYRSSYLLFTGAIQQLCILNLLIVLPSYFMTFSLLDNLCGLQYLTRPCISLLIHLHPSLFLYLSSSIDTYKCLKRRHAQSSESKGTPVYNF